MSQYKSCTSPTRRGIIERSTDAGGVVPQASAQGKVAEVKRLLDNKAEVLHTVFLFLFFSSLFAHLEFSCCAARNAIPAPRNQLLRTPRTQMLHPESKGKKPRLWYDAISGPDLRDSAGLIKVNAANADQRTALHVAACSGHGDVSHSPLSA